MLGGILIFGVAPCVFLFIGLWFGLRKDRDVSSTGSTNDNKDDQPEGEHFFRADLTPSQRLLCLDAIRSFATTSSSLRKSAEQAVQLAQRWPGSVKDVPNWGRLEAEVERRGGLFSLADVIEDGKIK